MFERIDYDSNVDFIVKNYYDDIEKNQLKPLPWQEWEEAEIKKPWDNLMLRGVEHKFGYLNGDRRYPVMVQTRETHTHLSIIGSTGSGKSVFENFIICNWCMSAIPEHLEIYGIDAKAVELTKYHLGDIAMPHFKVIAGTKDVEYVLSVIDFFLQKMAEQNAKLSVVHASDVESYYEKTGIRLPARVLLIDELGELLRRCNAKQLALIEKKLDSIGALGRNTQHVIVFATQVVPSELGQNILSHFGIRSCLKVGEQRISELALGAGNDAGYYIKQRGFCYVNHTQKTKETNQYVRIPYIDDNTFPQIIRRCYDAAVARGFQPDTYFYNEELRKPWEDNWQAHTSSPSEFMLGHAGQYIDKQWYQLFDMRPIPGGNLLVMSPDEDGLQLLREVLRLNLEKKLQDGSAYVMLYASTFGKLKFFLDGLPEVLLKDMGNCFHATEVYAEMNYLFTLRKQLKVLCSHLLIEYRNSSPNLTFDEYVKLMERKRLVGLFPEPFIDAEGNPTEEFMEVFAFHYDLLDKFAQESFEFSPYYIVIDGLDEIEGLGVESKGQEINKMLSVFKECSLYNIKLILIGEKLGEFTYELKNVCTYRMVTRLPELVCSRITFDNGHIIIPQLGCVHNVTTDERKMFKLLPNPEDEARLLEEKRRQEAREKEAKDEKEKIKKETMSEKEVVHEASSIQ